MQLSISERMYLLKTLPYNSIIKIARQLEISPDEFWDILRSGEIMPEEMILLCRESIQSHKKKKLDLDDELFG